MAKMTKSEKNGTNRCPHCGATDVKLDIKSGKLKCNFCRSLFDDVAANARGGVEDLKGDNIGDGAVNIVPDEKIIVTLKCPSCGAEVVINTEEAVSARCHWCRHTLSLNEKMKNGAVPDFVLPFKTEKTVAEENIRAFVKKRKFFAHPKFRKEFKPENVMGVYLPYMIVDVNAHANMEGEAEHLIRTYTSGGKNKTRYYDAEAFKVTRDFDLLVDDLTIEASSERLQQDVRANTNNVINAIMPFDTENCVDWNPNYLHGFASERRDTNVGDLKNQLGLQVGDIARYKVKESMTYYNRGAKWDKEEITTKGTKWKAAYLPVWLYSYLQDDGKTKMLHYVAVNARSGETMGSVPINKTRLILVSSIIEIIGIVIGWHWIKFWLFGIDIDADDDNPFWIGLAGLTPGFIFYWVQSARYRNMNARHKHEAETPSEVKNLKKTDISIGRRNRLRNSRIAGENDSIVKGVIAKAGEKMMGEKMANWLGIGRMAGSKANQTTVGQASEAEGLKAKKRAGRIVAIVIIFLFIIPMMIAVFALAASVMEERRGSSISSRDINRAASFADLKSGFKDWAEENNSFVGSTVTEIAIYDRSQSDNYRRFKVSFRDYNDALSIMKTDYNEEQKSGKELGSKTAKQLEEVLIKNGLERRLLDDYDDDGDWLTLGLYSKENSKEDSYIVCDLREKQRETRSMGYSYTTTLKCIDVDKEVIEATDIEL